MEGSRDKQLREPSHDMQDHGNWASQAPDEAWRELERRVARMEPILRAHHRELAKAEPLCIAHEAKLEELRASVRQVNSRHQQFYEEITNMRLDLHLKSLKKESDICRAGIDALRKDYASVNTDLNTINDRLSEFRVQINNFNTGLRTTSKDINQFKSQSNRDVHRINQNLKEIGEKTDREVKELKRQIDRQAIQCEKIAKINGDLFKWQESRIASLGEKMRNLNDEAKRDINNLKVEIKEVNKNLEIVTEDVAENEESIASNAQTLRKQISQVKYYCQKLKNDVPAKMDTLKSKLEALIKEVDRKNIQQVKKLKNQLDNNEEEMNEMDRQLRRVIEKLDEEERKKDEEERKQRIDKLMKQSPEKLIMNTTPYAPNFRLHRNIITLNQQIGRISSNLYQQLMMDAVVGRVFAFTIRIIRLKQGWITVGVVDKTRQYQARNSADSGNAVCYVGTFREGRICYGEGGECKQKLTGDALQEGMKVKVSIDKDTVRFQLVQGGWLKTVTKTHEITSSILSRPQSSFVPFIQMRHEGDSVEWSIQ